MRRPLFRRESTLLLVTIVMLGLGGEAVTRLIHTFHPLYEDKLAIYRGHPIFHHWRLPDQHTVWRSWEFTTSQRTNRFGMAGPDVALDHPPGVERIALIGDSFIEGFSTQEDERITRVLERLLNERAREEVSNPETVAGASEGLAEGVGGDMEQEANQVPAEGTGPETPTRYEVLNFGCASFSPSLEYFNLITLASRFSPDVVVLFFHFTDVTDDATYAECEVRDESGRMVAIDGGDVQPGTLYRLATHSALLKTVVQGLRRWRNVRGVREAAKRSFDLDHTFHAMFKHEYDEADLSAWSRTRSHLSKIARWCRSRDLPFHLVVLPAGPQIEPIGEMRRRIVMLSGESGLIRSTRLQDETLDWCRTENVTGLDLLPVMRDHKARHPEEVLFYPIDQHLTPAGNRVAAEAVRDLLLAHSD